MGAAARCDFTALARKHGAHRAADSAHRSGGCGEDNTSTTPTPSSGRTGGRRTRRHHCVARADAIAPVDGARSRNARARNRADQGQPAAIGPRQCAHRRAAQGEPGTNRSRHCQAFRGQAFRGQAFRQAFPGQDFRGQAYSAEPAARDSSASTTADCNPNAQAGTHALTIPGVGQFTARACARRANQSFTCQADGVKIFLFPDRQNSPLQIPPSRLERGALAIVTNVGAGCGGRGSVGRVIAIAGRFSVSDDAACRRPALQRTAKLCGPDTRCWCQACGGLSSPTGFGETFNPQATVTRRIRSPGRARHKP